MMMCMDFECAWMQMIAQFLYGPLRGARHVDDLIVLVHRYDYAVIKYRKILLPTFSGVDVG